MSDYGGCHFVNLVTGPKSKNTYLQDLIYVLHLKTVQVDYIILKESILDIHLHYFAF